MSTTALSPDQYVPPAVAAEFVGKSAWTLKHLRLQGLGPQYLRTSPRKISYRVGDLISWMERHRCHGEG